MGHGLRAPDGQGHYLQQQWQWRAAKSIPNLYLRNADLRTTSLSSQSGWHPRRQSRWQYVITNNLIFPLTASSRFEDKFYSPHIWLGGTWPVIIWLGSTTYAWPLNTASTSDLSPGVEIWKSWVVPKYSTTASKRRTLVDTPLLYPPKDVSDSNRPLQLSNVCLPLI